MGFIFLSTNISFQSNISYLGQFCQRPKENGNTQINPIYDLNLCKHCILMKLFQIRQLLQGGSVP